MIARDTAFQWIAIVVRVARIAIQIAKLKIVVVLNPGTDSYISKLATKKAKGAVGIDGKFGIAVLLHQRVRPVLASCRGKRCSGRQDVCTMYLLLQDRNDPDS